MTGMNRRRFLRTSAAALAWSHLSRHAAEALGENKRVGLIGTGWYGKADLFRLIQVAPVEVVSLCDVDSAMLSHAAEMTASRQASKKTPRTYTDYRKMLAEKDLDIVLVGTPDHWHALQMIAAVNPALMFIVKNPSASMSWKVKPWSPRHASTSASCKSARNAKARRT